MMKVEKCEEIQVCAFQISKLFILKNYAKKKTIVPICLKKSLHQFLQPFSAQSPLKAKCQTDSIDGFQYIQ